MWTIEGTLSVDEDHTGTIQIPEDIDIPPGEYRATIILFEKEDENKGNI